MDKRVESYGDRKEGVSEILSEKRDWSSELVSNFLSFVKSGISMIPMTGKVCQVTFQRGLNHIF